MCLHFNIICIINRFFQNTHSYNGKLPKTSHSGKMTHKKMRPLTMSESQYIFVHIVFVNTMYICTIQQSVWFPFSNGKVLCTLSLYGDPSCSIVIICERDVRTIDSLVWGHPSYPCMEVIRALLYRCNLHEKDIRTTHLLEWGLLRF